MRPIESIGREDLVDHPDYATPKDRRRNREALNAVIGEITATMTTATVVDKLNAAGIPCGPIYSIDQTFADPQVRHLGIAQAVKSSALGEITLVGQLFMLSRTPSRLVTAHRNTANIPTRCFANLAIPKMKSHS